MGETLVVQAAEPGALDIGETLQLNLRLTRRDWPWIILVFVVLGIAPEVGSSLFLQKGYRSGSHDLGAFSLYAGEAVAFSLVGYFWPLAVTALGVESNLKGSPARRCSALIAPSLWSGRWSWRPPIWSFAARVRVLSRAT